MAPGVGPLPPAAGARGTAGTVDPVAQLAPLLAALPPRTMRQIKLALRAFEWLALRRFSRASVSARQRYLRDLERDGSRLRRDLLLFLKVLVGLGYANDIRVEESVGYRWRCGVAEGAEPDAARDASLGDLEPNGAAEECDVIIVGSGAGGAVAATVLAESGLDVLVLEAGPHLDRTSFPSEPIAAIAALYRDGGLTIADGRPSIPTPVGRAVGGTTVINSGTCFRTPEPVLARWAAEHGIGWATKLESDFAQIEEMLDVREVDPERMGRNGQLLRAGAEALGVRHAPLRRNAGRCEQCSSCPIGCRLDLKRAMHVTYLPRAVAAGARVRAGVEARRILFEGRRAVGLSCLATPGEDGATPRPHEVRARTVVLAGGAFGTPELLLRSRFDGGGLVGRNLHIHPACWVGARFEEEVRGWDGVMQSYCVDEWAQRGILLEATFTPLAFGAQWLPGTGDEHQRRMLAYDRLGSTGVHLSDRSAGRVGLTAGGTLRVTYKLRRDEARELVFGIARAADLMFAAGATEVYPQIGGTPVLRRGDLPALESSPPAPGALRLEAFHPMGTAPLSADPA